MKMIIHLLPFLIPICLIVQPVVPTKNRQAIQLLAHRLPAFSHNSNVGGNVMGQSATKIAHAPSTMRFMSSTVGFGKNGISTSNQTENTERNATAVEHAKLKKDFGNCSTLKNFIQSLTSSKNNVQNEAILKSQKDKENAKFNEVQIRVIPLPKSNSLEPQIREVCKEVCKIMEKIMEIRVNVDFDGAQNYVGNGNKMVKHVELNGHDLMANLLEQNKQPDRIEMGQALIRAICGGPECDVHMELPEFRVDPCSVKPESGEDELDRALRPMLLKLAAKWQKGRLWVDNPSAKYRNIFEIAYEMGPGVYGTKRQAIEYQLAAIELNSPFFFRPISDTENNPRAVMREDRDKFKHRIQFCVHDRISDAPNGLQRQKELQIVKINKNQLNDKSHMYKLMLKALGVDCGEGLRILYDRRDKYLHADRQQFAKLNAAYGSENIYMRGGPKLFSFDRKQILDQWETSFWTEYANFETRKYEIPLVYDKSFVEQAEEHKELMDYVFRTFEEKSVIKFVVYKEPPPDKNYVRIYGDKDDYEAHAHVGCLDRNIFWDDGEEYLGQIVGFGKKAMTKYSLFHELLHTCGLEHEHQRADVTRYIDYDAGHIKKIWRERNDETIDIDFPVLTTYLPVNGYNPTSIMHYPLKKLKPLWAGVYGVSVLQKWKNVPDEPDRLDWENLNHFYGVGKGRIQFKVENGKIVDDIDGQRRLRKK